MNKGTPITSPLEFLDEIPQLYAPLGNYVQAVLPLMLEHVWQLTRRNHSSALEELGSSAWISRLITLDKQVQDPQRAHEIPGWLVVRDHLINCLEGCQTKAQIPSMINTCMEGVLPIIRQRFQLHYHFPARPFYCWWYTLHEDNTNLALHLVNAYQPESPFAHLPHFLATMLRAVEHARAAYPGIKIVSCGSWLNQLPKFQQLWPESFKNKVKVLNETGGFGPGVWGQYMTTEGGFHTAKADLLRKTGKHPFPLTEAQSPVDEVLAHLKTRVLQSDGIL